MQSISTRYLILLFSIISVFLLIKLPHIGIRMSDTNIYFYNGVQIAQGEVLYHDIFFTNFPLVPYIATLYYFLTFGNIHAYYATAIFETIITSFFIFLIARKYANDFVGLISSGLYLFSFLVLATTDHQTGVFAASLFEVLSLYFFTRKKYFLTGIFTVAGVLTKAYFLPLALSYGVYFIIKKEYRNIVVFITGSIVTAFVILIPSLLLARNEFFDQVFGYSLTRSAGLSKQNILWFFTLHDIPLVTLLIFNLFQFKKHLFFSLFSIFSILFIFFYQDIYYLYLNALAPVLCASFPIFWKWIHKKITMQQMVIPTILLCFWLYNIYAYSTSFASIQRFSNLQELIHNVQRLNPSSIYGTNDIAPVVAYLSGIPLLNNVTDTNENLYRKGLLNAKELTKDAIDNKSAIIAHGAFYPQFGIQEEVVNQIFDTRAIKKSCRKSYTQFVKTEGLVNQINLFRCD